MDRGLARWLLFGVAMAMMFFFFKPCGGGKTEIQPLKPESHELPPAPRPAERKCDLWHPKYHAQLSTRGATLEHFELTTAKYSRHGKPIDLSTTPDLEFYRQLRLHWRNEAATPPDRAWQVDFDSLDFNLDKNDGKTCEFSYRDAKVEVREVVRTTERPYELEVDATITNLANRKLRHALSVHTTEWRYTHEVEGGMFRVSPFVTHVECIPVDGKKTRKLPQDFAKGEFSEPAFASNPLNQGDWYQSPGKPDLAAVSNSYFAHAIVPVSSPVEPVCQVQVEEHYDPLQGKRAPNSGDMYRARLAYPPVDLEPNKSAHYTLLTYVGPKERQALAAVGGGDHKLSELIELGFFSVIAKVLVAFLLKVHSVIPNWGIAIIVLTLTARTLLFPLAVPSIRAMVRMRELKPEIDALNEKYKDDAQAKGLAQMELWRKHNVNPLKGCLPQLASMPVWFALYTTLQTAVELYNIPFLWFPDLSDKDPLYILPFIIGTTSFVQQKLMPTQGDPMQQKMLQYFMPAMFTVFMLFLPSGLGVYMFTNGVLGIIQQQIVERHARRTLASRKGSKGDQDKTKEEPSSSSDSKGKDRGRPDDKVKLSEGRPLLGKGKA